MGDLSGFLERLYDLLQYDEIRKSLFVVIPIATLLGFWIGRYFPAYRRLPPSTDVAPSIPMPGSCTGCKGIKRARDAVAANGPGLWLAVPPKFPANYHVIKSSIPIYTIANLKGGVGKTTIATGLASYFANPFGVPGRIRERVLIIDLDFQGSMSSMALTTAERIPHDGMQSRATSLLSGVCSGTDLIQTHQRVKGLDALQNGHISEFNAMPAYYDLAQAENRLMVEWLLSEGTGDVRYNLAEVLFSDEVQRKYDRIIIDAPPRLTTAHVQALAASTHVLIPTVLDQLSGEAVGGFVEQAIVHHSLWPHLRIIGVVGSMTQQDQHLELSAYEQEGRVFIEQSLVQVKDRYGLRELPTEVMARKSFIPEFTELSRAAGTRIGYLENSNREAAVKMRRIFDNLGQEVIERLPKAKELKDLIRS